MSNLPSFPAAPPTLLCIYFHDRGSNKISSPHLLQTFSFSFQYRLSKQIEEGKCGLNWAGGYQVHCRISNKIYSPFNFSDPPTSILSPPLTKWKYKVAQKSRSPPSYILIDRSMNPTEQQGLVFYHRTCWHWHLIFILFSLSFILFGDAHGILEGCEWKC